MIITDKFVFIHDPKTGGSFVTDSLLELHKAEWNRLKHLKIVFFPKVILRGKTGYGDLIFTNMKHGTCRYIPARYRDRKILATTRNPFDWYVSQYEFGWWKKRQFQKYFRVIENFEKEFPNFPDLKFSDFIKSTNQIFEMNINCPKELLTEFGWRTRSFVQYYFKKPEEVFPKMLDETYISSGAYKADMYKDINFINTKNLNQNLYNFLLQNGYKEEDVRFILEKKKVLPLGKGRTKEQKWEKYFTPELKAEIRQKDRILFQIFPEFDI